MEMSLDQAKRQGVSLMLKEQAVLNVLIYLFKHHLHTPFKTEEWLNELTEELETAGFNLNEIEQAFNWLDNLETHLTDSPKINHERDNALRVYSDYEINRISRAARGYLTQLEQQHILDPHLREIIIHQALIFERDIIDLNFLKWLTLMVLCNHVEQSETQLSQKLTSLEDSAAGMNVA